MIKVFETICGLVVVGGAGAMWHFWHVDGFIAVVMGLVGLGLVAHSFGRDLFDDMFG
jgi:hypothetical protein